MSGSQHFLGSFGLQIDAILGRIADALGGAALFLSMLLHETAYRRAEAASQRLATMQDS